MMATVDNGSRHRDALPPISHLELDKLKTDRPDHSRYPAMNGLNIATATLGSPSTVYSAPPPPYSYAALTGGSNHTATGGYISPPESTTRRSTRDEKESPARTSLPSIHEALGDKGLPFTASSQHNSHSAPSTTINQSFPEAPKGPSNPFSAPTFRENPFTSHPQASSPTSNDVHGPKPFITTTAPESRPNLAGSFGQPTSPRSQPPSQYRSGPGHLAGSTFDTRPAPLAQRSPPPPEQSRQPFSFSSLPNPGSSSYSSEPYQFSAGSKLQEPRPPFSRGPELSYGDTVKRHLDVFDAELGLNEIGEASGRTLDFARLWGQRYHQGNRAGYYQDTLPSLNEIDDMMRQSHRVIENLTQIRDVVVQHQNALSERMHRGIHPEDDYGGLPDEYKGGGFAGGDAKKRRGKAAPPGRCHSCNRAETPEWRRGPDGARTLCNACGLHYAKLTRKMGVNKAAALTGSNLRPKGLDPRP